jgi:CBS domain-containing protein
VTRIRDIYRLHTADADRVALDAPLDEVVERMARDRSSRVVFVVSKADQLLGMIRIHDVLHWLGTRYAPAREFAQIREILAATARDLMIEPVSVGLDDPVEEALRIAVQHRLEDVPVVEAGRLVGVVDGFEILTGLRGARGR